MISFFILFFPLCYGKVSFFGFPVDLPRVLETISKRPGNFTLDQTSVLSCQGWSLYFNRDWLRKGLYITLKYPFMYWLLYFSLFLSFSFPLTFSPSSSFLPSLLSSFLSPFLLPASYLILCLRTLTEFLAPLIMGVYWISYHVSTSDSQVRIFQKISFLKA